MFARKENISKTFIIIYKALKNVFSFFSAVAVFSLPFHLSFCGCIVLPAKRISFWAGWSRKWWRWWWWCRHYASTYKPLYSPCSSHFTLQEHSVSQFGPKVNATKLWCMTTTKDDSSWGRWQILHVLLSGRKCKWGRVTKCPFSRNRQGKRNEKFR